MKRQIFLSLLLIMFVGISLCGCSSINTVTTFYLDGSRSYYYQIVVDQQECQTLNIDPDQVMQKISTLAQAYCTNFVSKAQERGGSIDGVSITSQISNQNNYVYEVDISFESFDAFCKFYNITKEDLKNQKITYNTKLFTSEAIIIDNKIESQQDLIFSLGLAINWQEIKQSFADEFLGGDTIAYEALLNKINFNIVYCFPSQYRYHSNANQISNVTLSTGVNSTETTYYTAHLWKCNLSEPTPHIYVYKNVVTSANRTAWYCLAISITLIIGTIIGVYLYRKQKLKQETLTQFLQTLNSQPNDDIIFEGQHLTKDDLQKIAKQQNIELEQGKGDIQKQNDADLSQKD